MSTKQPAGPTFRWSVKKNLKNAIHARKAWKYGGTTEKAFEKKVMELFYVPIQEHFLNSSNTEEEVTLKRHDIMDSNYTDGEYYEALADLQCRLRALITIAVLYNGAQDLTPENVIFTVMVKMPDTPT